EEALQEYGIHLTPWNQLPQADAIVAAVSHREYFAMPLTEITKHLKPGAVFIDIKSAYNPLMLKDAGFHVWRL
ncbi:MAG: nucleotide sugar dehydrogenase, partial [Holosporaceae bacterium]